MLRICETAALWTAWCVVHSLLNADGIIKSTGILNSWFKPYYRLTYSAFATASLAVVWWLTPEGQKNDLWKWTGILAQVRIAIMAAASTMGYLSFRSIGLLDFLGLTALGIGRRAAVSSHELVTSGVYGIIRHPQSLAGMMLLWARDLNDTALMINVVLSAYLLIGARIEEKRMLVKFGDDYGRYKAKVPAFVPWKMISMR